MARLRLALEAGNAAEALEVLGRGPVDVLLTDMALRGLSGSELADEARRRQPSLAIVMATGYSSFSHPGAVTLPKPYRRKGLERALAEAVGLVRQTILTAVRSPDP
ncbi:response regulator [Azospirillum brasilense]|uniref:response regulator transcription factor n=1 Tax=Azospirillum argentinense TaxID=2970906 RepID=UPI00190EB15D|nr:response regulator [Azospirillum argentinense]MBK3803290.1 response regulator [Azospirillum argentinense]